MNLNLLETTFHELQQKLIRLVNVAIVIHCNLKATRRRASRSVTVVSELSVKILTTSLDLVTPIS